jgi:hypothetical protein
MHERENFSECYSAALYRVLCGPITKIWLASFVRIEFHSRVVVFNVQLRMTPTRYDHRGSVGGVCRNYYAYVLHPTSRKRRAQKKTHHKEESTYRLRGKDVGEGWDTRWRRSMLDDRPCGLARGEDQSLETQVLVSD